MSSSPQQIELPPLRSLNDFILESARFQLPNFNDFEKWGGRVIKNLLYYQTNYFAIGGIIFALMGIMYPVKIICGIVYLAAMTFATVTFFPETVKKSTPSTQNKGPNQYLIIGGIGLCGVLFLYMIEAILIVTFTFLLPICIAFVHSSLRLRNIKNKVVNTMENMKIRSTPMGFFLDCINCTPDLL